MKLKTKIIIGILFYFAIAFIFTGLSELKYLPCTIVGIALGYFTFKFMRRKQAEAEEEEQLELERQFAQPSAPKPTVKFRVVTTDEDEEGNEIYSIKGINFANIDDSYLGDHDGYIKAVTDNPKDPHAISVHVGNKRVGWLPAGNRDLHAELLSQGGRADVSITISKSYDKSDGRPFYHGKAFVPK